MPTLVFVLLIAFLFWRDLHSQRIASKALWIPLAWMFLAGSRWVSSWLNVGPTFASASDYSEGSPIDAMAFLSLIIAGSVVLYRRNIDWSRLLIDNFWIALYLGYCLASAMWSDEPLSLVKRWIKDLGNPIMALVMLTEPRPYEAIGAVFRRLAYLLLPLSVLFIRYYPWLGRAYHADGSPMYVGVGHQKNDLGLMCLVSGIYISWEFLRRKTPQGDPLDRTGKFILGGLFITLLWLLRMSDSQTSLVCLLVAVGIFVLARMPFIGEHPNMIVGLPVGGAFLFWTLDELFHLKDGVLALLGRNPTLTNRTELWEVVRQLEVDPLRGAGFMSFWSGERMDTIWAKLGPGINQAHNGYLEQYLNLGYIGVGFIGIIVATAILRVRRHLAFDQPAATLRLAFVAVAILYNFTEASFYGMTNMWVMLLLGCLEVPYKLRTSVDPTASSIRSYVAPRFRAASGAVLPVTPRRRVPSSTDR